MQQSAVEKLLRRMRRRTVMARSRWSRRPLEPARTGRSAGFAGTICRPAEFAQSGDPKAYPEVTGYLVPTLLDYGQRRAGG